MILRLYVYYNRDGLLVCPEKIITGTKIRTPDSGRRVFVAGDPDIQTLNLVQLNALIDLAFRESKIRDRASKAVFYDGKLYAERERRKIVLTYTWTHEPSSTTGNASIFRG